MRPSPETRCSSRRAATQGQTTGTSTSEESLLLAEESDLPAIIDCNGLGRGFWFHSAEGVDAVVQGIKVRNGVGLFDELGGGAVLIAGSSPSLFDCVFEECWARTRGGGIYIENGSGRPRIERCVIRSNVVGDAGVTDVNGKAKCERFS